MQHQQGGSFRQRLLFSAKFALQSFVFDLQLTQGQFDLAGLGRLSATKGFTPGLELVYKQPFFAAPGMQLTV